LAHDPLDLHCQCGSFFRAAIALAANVAQDGSKHGGKYFSASQSENVRKEGIVPASGQAVQQG
jgi:hypothetical protein